MYSKKQVIAATMTFILVFSVLVGCKQSQKTSEVNKKSSVANTNATGYPIVEEKITLKMMGINSPYGFDWNEMSFFKKMEEMTNIHFDFNIISPQAYEEKKNLAFASNDLPDVFFKANLKTQEEVTYGEQGLLVPLEELIKQYAPNISGILSSQDDVRRAITQSSGHIIALPYINTLPRDKCQKMWFNKKWLDKLGLAEPETIEDLYTVLKAFKNGDPNGNGKDDEIPITFLGISDIKIFLSSWGLLFSEPGNVYVNENNSVVFSPIQPEFKDGLKFLNRLFAEKIMDNESFTQITQQLNAKGSDVDERLGAFYNAGAFIVVGQERNFDYVVLPPIKAPNGKQVWPGRDMVIKGAFAISNTNKYPEASIRWVDYLYSNEGAILAFQGEKGEGYKTDTDGSWEQIIPENLKKGEARAKVAPQGGTVIPGISPTDFMLEEKESVPLNNNINQQVEKLLPFLKIPYPSLYMPTEKQKRLNSLNADIKAYVEQMVARFITGDASIETEWDNYVNTLKQMGMDEMVRLYQENYDDYLKR